jgi:hypothetical protein
MIDVFAVIMDDRSFGDLFYTGFSFGSISSTITTKNRTNIFTNDLFETIDHSLAFYAGVCSKISAEGTLRC